MDAGVRQHSQSGGQLILVEAEAPRRLAVAAAGNLQVEFYFVKLGNQRASSPLIPQLDKVELPFSLPMLRGGLQVRAPF
jgi:hypothetical protein